MFTRINANMTTETTDLDGFYLIATIVDDQSPDTSYLDQEDWADRKEAYLRDDFSFVGIVVTAYDDDDQEVGSTSLWGIETDSEPSYFAEMANEIAGEALPA